MTELILALGAGLLSFLSPCVLPLIPGYISYVSGKSLNELLEEKKVNIIPIVLFTIGFSLSIIYIIIIKFNYSFLNRIGKERVKANKERYTGLSEGFGAIKEIKDTSIKIAVNSVKKIISTSVDKNKLDAIFEKDLEEAKTELKKINS